jgi:hypothetical protein
MTSNLIPARTTSQVMYSRTTREALGVVQHNAIVRAADIEAQTELAALQFQAVGFMASVAMQEVALVSQVEQQLAQLVPLATSRLQAIGDTAALAMVQILSDAARRLG